MIPRSARQSRSARQFGSAPAAAAIAVAAVLSVWICCPRAAADDLCGQDERIYTVFDALFLQRNNAAVDRAIAVTSTAPGVGVLTAGEPNSTIGTGARILYGDYGADDVGWEVGYLGVYGMQADRIATDPAFSLQAPNAAFATASGLTSAGTAQTTLNSSINSAELNLVFHNYDGGFDRRSGYPWQRTRGYDGGHIDWLAGVRWANLEESAWLAFTPRNFPQPSTYAVNSSSNLFAAQVGVRGRMAFERWAFERTMKVGIAGTYLSQSQTMFDALVPVTPYRSPTSSDAAGMGMIAEINLTGVYRINETWGLRVGYNLVWLTGVALAADQWDFTPSTAGGTDIHGTGSVFLNGANLGLEARW